MSETVSGRRIINGIALTSLSDAVLRVEHNYMTLRTPSGWLLWSQKVTDESYLETVLKTATENLLSGFPE